MYIISSQSRAVRGPPKQEPSMMAGHGQSSKPNLTPSPISSSASQMKHETNFSLYGYQPFQHTYITHAQLKAREESKASAKYAFVFYFLIMQLNIKLNILKTTKDKALLLINFCLLFNMLKISNNILVIVLFIVVVKGIYNY